MRRRDRAKINRANAARSHIGFWTDARVDLLKLLWSRKMFAGDIAIEIGASCTRLMVIGKANRLGLEDHGGMRSQSANRRYGIEIPAHSARVAL